MEQPPTTERRIVSRIFVTILVVTVVMLLVVLAVVVARVRHRATLLHTLLRNEGCSVIARYEPYVYAPPPQPPADSFILDEGGGLRLMGFSIQSERPFWADWVAKFVDDYPFAEIQDIRIDDRRFQDADAAMLVEFPGLRVLNLSRTGITDEAVARLVTNSKLVTLDFSGTRISNQGLQLLDKLPELRELDIVGTRVTKEAVDEFRKRHPDCLVFH